VTVSVHKQAKSGQSLGRVVSIGFAGVRLPEKDACDGAPSMNAATHSAEYLRNPSGRSQDALGSN